MNQIEYLAKQTEDAYHWVDKLIQPIPYEKWDEIPEIIETSITWQVGHLLMSYYFHSVMVIVGHRPEIGQKVPLRDYGALFTMAPPKNALGKTNPETLHNQLKFVAEKSIDIIEALSPEDLENKLEPSSVPHPVAKTKSEALNWNIKHTMWHCGQISMLRRIIFERYNFGLQLPKPTS